MARKILISFAELSERLINRIGVPLQVRSNFNLRFEGCDFEANIDRGGSVVRNLYLVTPALEP